MDFPKYSDLFIFINLINNNLFKDTNLPNLWSRLLQKKFIQMPTPTM